VLSACTPLTRSCTPPHGQQSSRMIDCSRRSAINMRLYTGYAAHCPRLAAESHRVCHCPDDTTLHLITVHSCSALYTFAETPIISKSCVHSTCLATFLNRVLASVQQPQCLHNQIDNKIVCQRADTIQASTLCIARQVPCYTQ
jgi:hypothetical protein